MTRTKKLVDLIGESESNLAGEDREKVMELATMIEQIERNISRSLQHYANRTQLTLLEAQALAAILELGDKARLSSIADDVRMPLSTMTGVASRLEKAGLVERKRATDDGRASVLFLTDAGTTQVKEMFQPFFREVAQVIDESGSGTLDTLVDAFATVSRMAEQLGNNTESRERD